MPRAAPRDRIYLRRRFSADVIEQCVRWYLSYRLTYRDLAAMMAERGISVTHTTIMRWVLRYVPEYERRWARFARPVGSSWRMDETTVSIRGGSHYLYRAVDRSGKSVDSLLCSKRTIQAAHAFFRNAVTAPGVVWPRTINLDGNAASHRALRLLGQADPRWRAVTVRSCRYLNNAVEQDHRAIKQRCRPMLSFKSPRTAAVTLSGIELGHRIRKRQFWIDRNQQGRSARNGSLQQLWDRALTLQPMQTSWKSDPPLMHQNSPVRSAPRLRHHIDSLRRYPRKIFTGGGLYMYLTPSGGKHWRYKYHYAGKEKTL